MCIAYIVRYTCKHIYQIRLLSLHIQIKSFVQILFIFFSYFLFYLCFSLFVFSINHTALTLRLTFVSQVPGEPAASSQQLSHCPLPYAALLCQPERRQRAKLQSRGVFRCSRSDPELITVYEGTESLHLTLLFIISGFYWDWKVLLIKGNELFGIDLWLSSQTIERSAGSFTGVFCSEVFITSVLQIEAVTLVLFKRHSFQLLLLLISRELVTPAHNLLSWLLIYSYSSLTFGDPGNIFTCTPVMKSKRPAHIVLLEASTLHETPLQNIIVVYIYSIVSYPPALWWLTSNLLTTSGFNHTCPYLSMFSSLQLFFSFSIQPVATVTAGGLTFVCAHLCDL